MIGMPSHCKYVPTWLKQKIFGVYIDINGLKTFISYHNIGEFKCFSFVHIPITALILIPNELVYIDRAQQILNANKEDILSAMYNNVIKWQKSNPEYSVIPLCPKNQYIMHSSHARNIRKFILFIQFPTHGCNYLLTLHSNNQNRSEYVSGSNFKSIHRGKDKEIQQTSSEFNMSWMS